MPPRLRTSAHGFLTRLSNVGRPDGTFQTDLGSKPWRLRYLTLWGSSDARLLSLKVGIELRGRQNLQRVWREQLATTAYPVAPWQSSVSIEVAQGCVPKELQNPIGYFYTFKGETPISWAGLLPSNGMPLGIQDEGPALIRWTGTLYGLLLIGEEVLG